MLSSTLCLHRPLHTGSNSSTTTTMRNPHSAITLTLLILVMSSSPPCKGAPALLQGLQTVQESHVWNEIEDVCSSFLSTDPQSQASSALEEMCFMVLGIVHKSQDLKVKDHTKRFLFHYSKTHNSGNSDLMGDLQGSGGIQSRGYFLFRPRNGKRSTTCQKDFCLFGHLYIK
ncbi:neuromedin-U isoform X1 [Acipenser oxyrinchus oxyrinchus]|uniref:Neuromedin-U isoform X1 n=1 Tax=Acipenser oxyrinchus oxyrinchus TaxID=40147 RepID=A0AAD8LU50_ACIOX|nr:neuromedin-U isoform X1 [Acipenser oxyrinchus oxyrinchus]